MLVELVNVAAADRDEWARWYDSVYVPECAAVPGVRFARRLAGLAEVGQAPPVEAGVLELATADVLESAAWSEAHGLADEWSGVTTATAYRQIAGPAGEYRPPDAKVLHGAFFDVSPEHHDEFNDWYELEHLPSLMQVPGYLLARRFQHGDSFLALYDVDTEETARSREAFEATQSPWSDRVRAKLVRTRARRIFGVEAVFIAATT